jgi:CRISPR/Cas system CMR-associated protein Cmr5 small subunit
MDLGTVVHAGIAGAIRYYGSKMERTKAIFRRTDAALVESCQKSVAEMVKRLGGSDYLTAEESVTASEIEERGIGVARRTVAMLELERWMTYWYKDEPLVEQKLYYETEDFIYTCIPDWVAEDLSEGGVWILDYKVRKQFQPPESEEVNVQFPAYQYVLARIGLQTTGSIMVQTKAVVPSIPKLNQNGSMSRAKIATTWDIYKAELIRNNLNPDDYQVDMESKLTTAFDRLDRVHRNEFIVNGFWDQLVVPAAREMLKSPEPIRHMNHMNCNGCWAREFCLGELYGEDTDFLLQTNYVDTNNPAPRVILRPQDIEFSND